MRPLAALRGRFAHVPAAVLRRSESGAARAAVIGDVRAVFPDVPRDAGPERLIRHARRLVLAAARDEFVREGVELVDLPEGWGRAELRRADIAGDAAFRGFVEEVIGALDIAPSPFEKDDALELRDGPYSADHYGLSLEAGADLASYLLSRAWMLMALELVEELEAETAEGAPGRRALPVDTTPAPRDEQEFFEAQAAVIREEVRARLVRLVRVPLELRAALERHARLEGAAAADDPAGAGGGPAGRRAGAPRPGAAGGGAGHSKRTREDIAKKASSAFEFAQSEVGRTAFGMLRDGAEKAYGAYSRRGGADGTARKEQDLREP